MKKPAPKLFTVIESEQITPNMQRITLKGEDLSDYPDHSEGSYVKLQFNTTGGTDLTTLNVEERPILRTYTIRHLSKAQSTIEIDFVRHTTEELNCGFAARWAMSAQIGDTINIAGPGKISELSLDADWFFTVADMTALPALTAKVRQLPKQAKGYAVIKVTSQDDIQPLDAPSNFQIKWLVEDEMLEPNVKALPWLDGIASVWVACEFDSMRALRNYFRSEKEIPKENIYISSYWKRGVTEDGHKVIKQKDASETT
ncbi:siderophore-interacting protein [Vibrio sp. RC27]